MRLELEDDEADVLRDFIESHLGDISMEISHTDNPAYRGALRRRRDTLRAIATKMNEQPGERIVG